MYLAHESQVPNPGDYFTTYIGRQPIVITRDKQGALHPLINACAHRGAMLCRRKTDNRTTFTCPFHGWTFRNDGKLLKVKDPDGAGYPEHVQQGRLARPHQGGAVRQLPRIPLRQPQPGRHAARRAPRRLHQGHRHARGPVPGGPGSPARLIDLHVRRQLEGAGRERRRRLPRLRHALELRGHHRPAQHRRVEEQTKALDAGGWGKSAAATGRTRTGTCACGPGRRTRRTARCGTAWTSSRSSSATPRASSWSRAPAISASTRTSI